jgi:hypothetical protein
MHDYSDYQCDHAHRYIHAALCCVASTQVLIDSTVTYSTYVRHSGYSHEKLLLLPLLCPFVADLAALAIAKLLSLLSFVGC